MMKYKAWPFVEAERILAKIQNKTPEKGYVLFETGYGPSGLPHIGTFGEVSRTTMVRNAFKTLSPIPSKLFTFSDDLDGLRKIPDNVPNKEMLKNYLGMPLSSIPDPFEKYESFAAYMNNKLRSFLDEFGFEYEFKSATICYKRGDFDPFLLTALRSFDKIMKVMLPTLGEERQATYSPFLPICPETGKVLQVQVVGSDIEKGTISYHNEDSKELITVPVTGGHCKMQWKADWALRWAALDVDYEMHGKDLIPTEELSTKICKIIGGAPPVTYNYELFLDENGHKISKSKGNGIGIEEWLKYATTESLSLFMYQSPHKAKRLYFDVIPKNLDEYIIYSGKYNESDENKYENPLWHIHSGNVKKVALYNLDFNLLLNLASACNPDDKTILWGFIKKYAPEADENNDLFLDQLISYAINYYNDFIKPYKKYKTPDEKEILILHRLAEKLGSLPDQAGSEIIQNSIYDISKEFEIENLREFFKSLYEILLGQTQGPRLGSFFELYGINETINLINKVLDSKNKIFI